MRGVNRALNSLFGRPPAAPPRPSLVGRTAEAIAGSDPSGAPARREWETGRRELVAFLTGGCTTCGLFWTGFAAADPGAMPVVVVTPGPGGESRRVVASLAGDGLDVIMSTEAWLAYGVRGAPWFVVVADGQVAAEGSAASWDELRRLTRT